MPSLITKYPDGIEYRYDGISSDDLSIVNTFFEKAPYYEPAKKEEIVNRIRKILGVGSNTF